VTTRPAERTAGDPTEVTDGRLTVRTAGPPDLSDPRPGSFFEISHQLAELVDFHDRDFSGNWYDPAQDQEVIGVATDSGLELLETEGILSDTRVRVERVRWSLREGQEILTDYLDRSLIKDRFRSGGTMPEGDGFRIGLTGDGLTDAERADLLTLPGRIEVTTGEGEITQD